MRFISSPRRWAAADARALGAALLREAIALRGELDLDSYDRFSPSQDYPPERGFGNLIALPLQGQCRGERNTTVFVDPQTFAPWPDQFAFLSSLARITPTEVRRTAQGLRPVVVGPEARLHRSTLRPDPEPPAVIEAQLTGMLAIRRAGIPPGLYASLKHLAVLHNSEFHKNEWLRMSNHAASRFIRCYAEDLETSFCRRASSRPRLHSSTRPAAGCKSTTRATTPSPWSCGSPASCAPSRPRPSKRWSP